MGHPRFGEEEVRTGEQHRLRSKQQGIEEVVGGDFLVVYQGQSNTLADFVLLLPQHEPPAQ